MASLHRPPLRTGSFVATIVAIVASACSSESATPSSDVVRADSAGVEYVLSPAADRPLDWTFEERAVIGGAEEGPESFSFLWPASVGADADGAIYILDGQAGRVVVFSSEGEYLRSMGHEGEGPGELSRPATLAVEADGTASVFDYGKGGLVRFDPDGAPLPEVPAEFFPSPGSSRHIAYVSGGLMVVRMLPFEEEGQFRQGLQLVTEADTTTVAEVAFPAPGMARYPSCGGGLNLPRIFEPEITWDATDDAAVVSATAAYSIDVFDGPNLVRRVMRDIPRRPATEELAVEELDEGFRINFGRGVCTIPPQEMVSKRGYADFIPHVGRLVLAPGGQLWVQRKAVGTDAVGAIDVFDASGAYLGTLPTGTPLPLLFLGPDRYGAAVKDALDVTRLAIYDVVRGP